MLCFDLIFKENFSMGNLTNLAQTDAEPVKHKLKI